jgi:N-methylhydantoinase A
MRFRRSANLHYQGQIFELSVAAPIGQIDHAALATLAERFGQEHETTYGHRAGPEEPVELVTIELVGEGVPEFDRVPDRLDVGGLREVERGTRRAYFGPDLGWIETDVIARSTIGSGLAGPFIVEEYDATCLIPPGASASLDDYGNIDITLE